MTDIRPWCIVQVETGLYDGWYYLPDYDQRAMLQCWDALYPEFTHRVTRNAPAHLDDRHLINARREFWTRSSKRA